MMKCLITLLLISLPIHQQTHKFYLSLTDIVYDQEESRLEITSDVFIDDFELLLTKRYQKKFKLIKDEEYDYTQKFIKRYINDKLGIIINDKQKAIKYLGKSYKNDKLRFYLLVNNVEPFKKIRIKNLILTDMFDDQKNMVHVNNGVSTKSLLLEKDRSEGLLKF
ncbi:MAG: hypothetical protein RI558_02365 [Psychroflexus sp.]|nr:hypothetical protein [Psychroflexus sp.]MDR9448120.1 hypothetical protein [Psychroflexus sp.]